MPKPDELEAEILSISKASGYSSVQNGCSACSQGFRSFEITVKPGYIYKGCDGDSLGNRFTLACRCYCPLGSKKSHKILKVSDFHDICDKNKEKFSVREITRPNKPE
jgi:hypothetical protein